MLAIEIPHLKILEICKKWHVAKLALFGSVLTTNFSPQSNIDVLVTFEPDGAQTVPDLPKMKEQLEVVFGRTVELVTRAAVEKNRNSNRRAAILSTAHVIFDSKTK